MNPTTSPLAAFVLVLIAFFALALAYTTGFRRGAASKEDDVAVWVWNKGAPDVQHARSSRGELLAYKSGAWEIRTSYPANGFIVANGEEPDQARAQIRAMRVYRALTETIASAGERGP